MDEKLFIFLLENTSQSSRYLKFSSAILAQVIGVGLGDLHTALDSFDYESTQTRGQVHYKMQISERLQTMLQAKAKPKPTFYRSVKIEL